MFEDLKFHALPGPAPENFHDNFVGRWQVQKWPSHENIFD